MFRVATSKRRTKSSKERYFLGEYWQRHAVTLIYLPNVTPSGRVLLTTDLIAMHTGFSRFRKATSREPYFLWCLLLLNRTQKSTAFSFHKSLILHGKFNNVTNAFSKYALQKLLKVWDNNWIVREFKHSVLCFRPSDCFVLSFLDNVIEKLLDSEYWVLISIFPKLMLAGMQILLLFLVSFV